MDNRAIQGGAGMIEVLIAISIITFALFGVAGLQIVGLRYQKTAHFLTLAAYHSANLAEKVRANIRGAHGGDYSPALQHYLSIEATAPICRDLAACTPAEVAAKDIHQWRNGLRQVLAGGWGEISGSMVDGFTIRVYFQEQNRDAKQDDVDTHPDNPALTKKNCRLAALHTENTNDVRCFSMVFLP